jgi:heme iron utilization protein
MDTPKQDAMAKARALLAAGGTGALSVIDVDGGAPFTTLVNVAVDRGLNPLILISDLSYHTKCLKADGRANLMLHDVISETQDPMLTYRVSLAGTFAPVPHDENKSLFIQRHPYAEMYVDFGDFNFWCMTPTQTHIIAGFGRAYSVRFKDIAET